VSPWGMVETPRLAAILHRKNALFFKTENGGHTGEVFMSPIYTCQLCSADPFHYLTELREHAAEIKGKPPEWMPCNCRDALQSSVAPHIRSRQRIEPRHRSLSESSASAHGTSEGAVLPSGRIFARPYPDPKPDALRPRAGRLRYGPKELMRVRRKHTAHCDKLLP